ncbi:MAG: efflux RND transporter periplasmic adaptor subunit [Candidatus Binatia bacterium]
MVAGARYPAPIRLVGLLGLLSVAACGKNQYVPPPPADVTVAHPVEREVTTYNEFSGHTVAVAAIDIRARVQGNLQSIHFAPGGEVKEGDLLFVIEPTLYQARVQQADADLARAQAQVQAAQQQLAIAQQIFERNAGSKTELVQKTQARDEATAAVSQAQANLAAAQLDLSYTHIYAPMSGRIDRNLVDAGNLVGNGQATLLASIVRSNPIYAYFEVSERDLLNCPDLLGRRGTATDEQQPRAELGLVTEEGFPHQGFIDYTSNRVDSSTGTMEVRAIFDNASQVILPGLFVRVRVPSKRGKSLLVPDQALGNDQSGHYLLSVDEKNIVQHRRVTVGPLVDGMRVIAHGVQPGEWVVINGLQRARPGTEVKPIQVTNPTPRAARPEPAA